MLTVVVLFGLVWSKSLYHLHLVCSGLVRITVLDFKFLLEEAKLENPPRVLKNTCHSLPVRYVAMRSIEPTTGGDFQSQKQTNSTSK